jgi:hypothetical protein
MQGSLADGMVPAWAASSAGNAGRAARLRLRLRLRLALLLGWGPPAAASAAKLHQAAGSPGRPCAECALAIVESPAMSAALRKTTPCSSGPATAWPEPP